LQGPEVFTLSSILLVAQSFHVIFANEQVITVPVAIKSSLNDILKLYLYLYGSFSILFSQRFVTRDIS